MKYSFKTSNRNYEIMTEVTVTLATDFYLSLTGNEWMKNDFSIYIIS